MSKPNFLVIGAAKAGTTSLYQYLSQHPQIYMSPIKEPRFFLYEGKKLNYCGPGDEIRNENTVTNIDDYLAIFKDVKDEIAIGEASTEYLHLNSEKCAERIFQYNPHFKIIVILRNPADRAYSTFLYLRRDGRETKKDFSEALKVEQKRIRQNWAPIWGYLQYGYYYTQLKPYYDRFPNNQIRIYIYENWLNNNCDILKDVFGFLNVETSFVPDISKKFNVSFIPKSIALSKLIDQPSKIKRIFRKCSSKVFRQWLRDKLLKMNSIKPQLEQEIREKLISLYKEEIIKLQNMIKQDLSKWLR